MSKDLCLWFLTKKLCMKYRVFSYILKCIQQIRQLKNCKWIRWLQLDQNAFKKLRNFPRTFNLTIPSKFIERLFANCLGRTLWTIRGFLNNFQKYCLVYESWYSIFPYLHKYRIFNNDFKGSIIICFLRKLNSLN